MIGGNYLWVADIDGDNLRQLGGEAHSQHGIPLPAEWSPDGRELLVPFVTALVPVVDLAARRVEVADRPGLLTPLPDDEA